MHIRQILLALACALILLSCTKKNEVITCTETVVKGPCALAFAGYSKFELNTVVVQEYKGGSNFTQLVYTGVLNDTNLMQRHDTLMKWQIADAYYSGVASLMDGYDYRIFVPSANRTYDITNIEYAPDSTFTFETTQDVCPPYQYGYPHFMPPIRLDLNGQTEQLTFKLGGASVLFVRK